MEFRVWVLFLKKSVDKVQVSLKSDKNNGCFTRGAVYALKISRSILLSIKNICGKLCGENQTHIFCSVTFPENYAIHEIMWKNIAEPYQSQMTIWRMCVACWIPKATNTRSQYVTLIAFPMQQWLRERTSILGYTDIVFISYTSLYYDSGQIVILSILHKYKRNSEAFNNKSHNKVRITDISILLDRCRPNRILIIFKRLSFKMKH